jgi:serine/threonine protein phosphatase 1
MLQSFKKNPIGNDYICSDIHGHFYILEAELLRIGFDEQTDRLFCLGDLIDRGDESALALEWLKRPWFFAIQGNHERMLINAFESDSEILWRQWMMWVGIGQRIWMWNRLNRFIKHLNRFPLPLS